jgi:hypothetical protein
MNLTWGYLKFSFTAVSIVLDKILFNLPYTGKAISTPGLPTDFYSMVNKVNASDDIAIM